MEHLLNCHGEWVALLALLANLPLVGVWVRAKLTSHSHAHEEGAE